MKPRAQQAGTLVYDLCEQTQDLQVNTMSNNNIS